MGEFPGVVSAFEGPRSNSVGLNGTWSFARGTGDEQAEAPAGQQQLQWQPVTLPGPFMAWNQEAASQIKFIWARRRFALSASQSESMAVLRWNRIASGAVAFINGQKVGENEPTGPFQVIVPPGVLRAGDNEIVLKICGARGVRRSRSGNPLIPSGFGVGMPEVTDDIWLDFADAVYLKWVLAIPDLAAHQVKIRVTPTGIRPVDDLQIFAQVKPWPDGNVLGEGKTSAQLTPDPDPLGGRHFYVEVPMPGFKAWTHEDCPLYTARIEVRKNGRILDELSFRFGMREIKVQDRHFQLNGKILRLRGSNLVFEWNWDGMVRGKEIDYLVKEAREMNMNSFRTHTQPPPRLWCDIADEHGTMILAEFPVLYNYVDYHFNAQEYQIWHRNVLTDAAGWMSRLWNHPAVIMWVLSNESRQDNEWEEGPFQEFVNALDPTRPTLRTGTTGTKDNYDVHTCGNVTDPDEGQLQLQIPSWFKEAGNRTTTDTEYMNTFDRPATQWAGRDDPEADQLAIAQIGMEHTEAMRRARLDGLWPYMYAGWTKTRRSAPDWGKRHGGGSAEWKAGYACPLSACWHSALSPVLASLDLFNPNYLAGQEVTTDLHLINDSWHDAKVHVDLLLTRECPEFIPEAACFDAPVRQWNFDFSLKADSIKKVPVTWELPHAEGSYWLAARMTGIAGRPVLSQRFVRAIKPPVIPEAAKQREFVVLAGDQDSRAFFQSRGLSIGAHLDNLSPANHRVVVWDASRLTDADKRQAGVLKKFLNEGGTIVVLSTPSWNWPELCQMEIGRAQRFSRVFRHNDINHPLLSGIEPAGFVRWNGLPGTVGRGPLEGAVVAGAEKILWAREPKTTVMAVVPAPSGPGHIVFAQLDLQSRLDKSKTNYDPVAESLMLNLLGVEYRDGKRR